MLLIFLDGLCDGSGQKRGQQDTVNNEISIGSVMVSLSGRTPAIPYRNGSNLVILIYISKNFSMTMRITDAG